MLGKCWYFVKIVFFGSQVYWIGRTKNLKNSSIHFQNRIKKMVEKNSGKAANGKNCKKKSTKT